MIDYPKTIKELRNQMFLTQEEFAKKLGVAFITVNRWENGYYEPTIKMKKKLNEYFKKYKINIEGRNE